MRNILTRWRQWWDPVHETQSDFVDGISARYTRLAVVAASALALYTEMVIVRWHATCFHAFAIFKNVSLLSCFLGLGIGYGLSSRRRITLAAFLPLLAFQTLLFGIMSCTNLGGRRINPVSEQLVMGTAGPAWSWLNAVEGNTFLALVFVLNAVMFIPLGHLAGRLMARLPRMESYSLNLLGSLLGIGLFFVLCLAWTSPAVWLGTAALLAAPFLVGQQRAASVGIASIGVILVATGLVASVGGEQTYYSPYQVISLQMPRSGDAVPTPNIRVNHCFFQEILDSRPPAVAACERNAKGAVYYDLPYRLCGAAGDVLVVGAGSGNDVAAALRNGASSVTAVEIDPAIVYLGQCLHPERPYQDPRTNQVTNDARSYLRQTDASFDTVIYGLLDSHTNLGAMTNVRLDSFVYTVEGFREAIQRLKPGGLIFVSYCVLDQVQGNRLYAMLSAAYPQQTPRAFIGRVQGSTIFVTGPGLSRIAFQPAGVEEVTAKFADATATTEMATDDWPFFYMKERSYPVTYALMIAILLALSCWMVKKHLQAPRVLSAKNGVFFFLGAGFMLVETKTITELGLIFGNTWSVIAIAVTGILVMVFLSNLVIQRRGPLSTSRVYAALAAAIGLGWILTQVPAVTAAMPWPKLVMPVVLTLPLFFAGLIFSSELSQAGSLGEALSANLFGAILGGFLEYNSMYWGLASLYPLGIGLYGLAFLSHLVARRRQVAVDATQQATLSQAA
jgi:spermidine synthase